MKLVSLLNKNFIKIQYEVKSKEEAIFFLIDTISKEFDLHSLKDLIMKKVLERETLGGTSFETGIAIPHARLEDFNDLVIAICVPKKPFIDNGIEIKMVVLILTSKSSSKTYLQVLSSFAQISQDKVLFDKLSFTKNSNDFLSLIDDLKIKKDLTVEDIMTKEILKVTQQTTLKEILDIFYKNNISYAPVIDEKDNFIAEVTMLDLLKVGIPNYALMMGNLKFLTSFEPLEELLKNEETILVKDIMVKPDIMLEKDSSIIEAALKLTQKQKRHIPVVFENKVIGVVSFMDILKKVIRG
ncbi:MAG TPA: PTS sugar transporter subunit IIA [Spirochaetota bacterium]|nr:PTS sugar transporter subunit IIA [Spirochaetota bacterium]